MGITMWNCDLCGHQDATPIEAARPYVGDNDVPMVCNNCGFIYVRERRTPEEIAEAWNDIWSPEGYTSAWPAVVARLHYVAEWIYQNIGLENKRVLDIGAGEGKFMDIVARMGAIPFGIEPSVKNCTDINEKHGFRCRHGTVEQVNLQPEYDIVTVNWTLENTGDCIGFLKKARTFLKPNGHLVVATGSRILVPFKKPLSTYFSTNPADTHCFRFSVKSLANAFTISGFNHRFYSRIEECDWLVIAGEPDEPRRLIKDQYDSPQEVLRFFDDWQRMWP